MDKLELKYTQHKDTIESDYFYNKVKELKNYKLVQVKTEYLEPQQLQKNLIPIIDKSKKILVVADTGIGKTSSILNVFGNNYENSHIAFLLPNTANVQQIENEYSNLYIQALYENSDPFYHDNGLVVSTWDSIKKVDIGHEFKIVIQDEIHSQTQSMDYRPNAINLAQKIDRNSIVTIDITATPKGLNLSNYDYVIHYQKDNKINIPIEINLYSYKKDIVSSLIYKDINSHKNGKFLVLKQDKDFLINFVKYMNINSNKKAIFLSANSKYDNQVYKDILSKRTITTDMIGHTNIFATGININNEENIYLYLINIKDPITIKQYIARFRKAKSITVHIFNNFSDNTDTIINSYSEILHSLDKTSNEIINNLNSNNLTEKIQSNIYKEIDKSLGIEYNKVKKEYFLNDIRLQYLSYRNYTNQFDQLDLKFSLLEYFNHIKIKEDPNNEINKELMSLDKISKEIKDNTYKALYTNTLDHLLEYDKNIVNTYKYYMKKYDNFNKSSLLKTLNNQSISKYIKAYVNMSIIRDKNVDENSLEYKFIKFIKENIKFNKVYTNFELNQILKNYNKENNIKVPIKSLNEKVKKYFYKTNINNLKKPNNKTYYYKFEKITRPLLTDIINQNKKINELCFKFSKNDIDKIISVNKKELKITIVN